jgi:hypothetical protein
MSHVAYYCGDSHPLYLSIFIQCCNCLFPISEESAEGLSLQRYCEVLEVLCGSKIALQEFADTDFQKCFRQLYKCRQMYIAVEEQYF